MDVRCGKLITCVVGVVLGLVGVLLCLAAVPLSARAHVPDSLLTAEDTQVMVDPPDVEVRVGATTVVSVRIENVTDLYAVDLYLAFDPSVLEVVDADPETEGVQIEPGPFLGTDATGVNVVYAEEGEIDFSQGASDGPVSGPYPNPRNNW